MSSRRREKAQDMRPVIGLTLALALATAAVFAQSAQVDQHIAAAKTAAQDDHGALFTSLCSAEPTGPGTGRRGGTGQRQDAPPGPPARDAWHAEPMKVFDNLYFVGMKDVSAWALTTSAGIIVIDALYDYSVDDEVAEGLKKVGLDPANIKYVIVSNGSLTYENAQTASGGGVLLESNRRSRGRRRVDRMAGEVERAQAGWHRQPDSSALP
jgi:hypothetical protein